MFKNVASQKITLFAFDVTTGLPKTGDAANLTFYVSKDDGSVTALTDTSASEIDNTNAKGMYTCDLTQGETNANKLVFSGKSSTSNIVVVPVTVYTRPPNFSTLVIDSSGLADANTVKVGPSGSGTAQTARDLGASVLLSPGTGTGQVSLSSGLVRLSSTAIADILTTQMTEAYNSDGAAPTLAQALFFIMQILSERSISSTTMTIKKLDGTTTAFTLTLNDATNPTALTRAT